MCLPSNEMEMADNNPTSDDVYNIEAAVPSARVNYDDSTERATVVVSRPDNDAGRFFKELRAIGVDPIGQSRRVNGELVARIDAEPSGGLKDLFR